METLLPRISIADTEYFVDVKKGQFRKVNEPHSVMFSELIKHPFLPDQFILFFDAQSKTIIHEDVQAHIGKGNVLVATVPKPEMLDPKRYSELTGIKNKKTLSNSEGRIIKLSVMPYKEYKIATAYKQKKERKKLSKRFK